MSLKPILFNTEMVRALLAGQKSVTRRPVRCRDGSGKRIPLPTDVVYTGKSPMFYTWAGREPYHIESPYQLGEVLYVRETWAKKPFGEGYIYPTEVAGAGQQWHPSIHMPREAARIFLQVTGVRVERLQDITPEQIDAEGCKEYEYSAKSKEPLPSNPSWFRIAWDNTIKSADRATCGWEANPWVWVVEFERIGREEAKPTK